MTPHASHPRRRPQVVAINPTSRACVLLGDVDQRVLVSPDVMDLMTQVGEGCGLRTGVTCVLAVCGRGPAGAGVARRHGPHDAGGAGVWVSDGCVAARVLRVGARASVVVVVPPDVMDLMTQVGPGCGLTTRAHGACLEGLCMHSRGVVVSPDVMNPMAQLECGCMGRP